jgi:Zn-dependent protease with chaperone function
MRRGLHSITAALLAAALPAGAPLSGAADVEAGAAPEKLEGYAEWRRDGELIVGGQRLALARGGKFAGEAQARDFDSVPLGYEISATGRRRPDGALLATEVQARSNGTAMFEKEVRQATDKAEASYRRAGAFYQTSGKRAKVVGRLHDDGPEVQRVRRIVDRLVPPYLKPGDVRVYVIDNPEWNAFAMGNYSVYVFRGLLKDMDDDEVAMVLGHEIAHATHEHTRRQFKKRMWIQIVALGALVATQKIDDQQKRAMAALLTQFGALVLANGYGRELEDQADRVGLRYAYEGGYDVSRGPAMWLRFANRYGERGRVTNFFFSDHSQSRVRAANLERELRLNYPGAARRGAGS